MKCYVISLLLCLVSVSAHAASFDCAGALTKIERQICETGYLSRLDDEMANVYSRALGLSRDVNKLREQQREWLNERNKKCVNMHGHNAYTEEICLSYAYKSRIREPIEQYRELDGYTLLLNNDLQLCQHMLKLFTDDLRHYLRGNNEHEEFDAVPWRPVRIIYSADGKERYLDARGANFDFNNDGVSDFVVKSHAQLSGIPADSIAVFMGDAAGMSDYVGSEEFYNANNFISLAGGFYELSGPFTGQSVSLWLLSPFIYQGVSYLYMQSLYETNHGYLEDMMIVSKYTKGRFDGRDMTGVMDDVCYFKRFGDAR
jgi:uncharacterized protein YecT (DUF1311 family)